MVNLLLGFSIENLIQQLCKGLAIIMNTSWFVQYRPLFEPFPESEKCLHQDNLALEQSRLKIKLNNKRNTVI